MSVNLINGDILSGVGEGDFLVEQGRMLSQSPRNPSVSGALFSQQSELPSRNQQDMAPLLDFKETALWEEFTAAGRGHRKSRWQLLVSLDAPSLYLARSE